MTQVPNPMQVQPQAAPASIELPQAAMPVQAPPAQPPQQAPPASSMSLEDYAQGMAQLNIELQRQTDAYGHFRDVVVLIDKLIANPNQDRIGLPFVSVNFPTSGSTPGTVKLDLGSLPVEQLAYFRPMFAHFVDQCGRDLLAAWENVHGVADATRPIVEAARGSR